MKNNETNFEAKNRYSRALHAVQTGVRCLMEAGEKLAEPKHLRVGMDSAQVSVAALAKLLIAKGIITENKVVVATADEMEREKVRYEERCTEKMGCVVKLH